MTEQLDPFAVELERRRAADPFADEMARRTEDVPLTQRGLELTSGINYEGIPAILGAPVDAMNWVLGQTAGRLGAPIPEEPFLGSAHIQGMMGAAGIPDVQPTDETGELLRSIGAETGATAATLGIPFAPAVRGAGAVGRALTAPATEALQAGRLGTYAAGEAAATLGAGAGAHYGQELLGDEVGGVVGELIGGVAPGTAAAGAIGINNLIRLNAPRVGGSDAAVREVAAASLQNQASDPALSVENIRANDAIVAAFPDYQPRTAELADDVGLSILDRGIATGYGQTQMAEAFDQNRRALDEALGIGSQFGDRPPRSDMDALSTRVVASIDAEREAFRAESRRLYNAVDPDNRITFDPQPLREWVSDTNRLVGEGLAQLNSNTERLLEGISGRIADNTDIPLQWLVSQRQNITRTLRDYYRDPAAHSSDIEALTEARAAIDATLDDLASRNPQYLTSEMDDYVASSVEAYRRANQHYRENIGRFEDPVTSRIINAPARTDERVVDRFLSGGERGSEALRSALDNDPALVGVVRDYLETELRSTVPDANGMVRPGALRRYLDRRGAVIADVFGDAHLARLNALADAYALQNRPFSLTQTVPGSATAQNQAAQQLAQIAAGLDTRVMDILGSVRNMVALPLTRGREGLNIVGTVGRGAISTATNRRAVAHLIQQAMLNPDLATELLSMSVRGSVRDQEFPLARAFLTIWANQAMRTAPLSLGEGTN